MLLSDFNYDLPENFIAQTPAEPRDTSKLLVYDKITKKIEHKIFKNIIDYLKPDDVLVLNNTKVSHTRINFTVPDSKKIFEIFILHKSEKNIYECMVYPGKKFKLQKEFIIFNKLKITVIEKTKVGRLLKLESINSNISIDDLIKKIAEIPLPPYITEYNGPIERYQTVFSEIEGSTAAPTASLHFTEKLLNEVKLKIKDILKLTLNIGPGTFQPIKTENLKEHIMHKEKYSIEPETYNKILNYKKNNCRIIAVGTTVVRTLETIAINNSNNGNTDLFIYPGFKFNIIDALITNFHLPKSSLLMLVSAFINDNNWKSLYTTAIQNNYKFFSFGDAMFIK